MPHLTNLAQNRSFDLSFIDACSLHTALETRMTNTVEVYFSLDFEDRNCGAWRRDFQRLNRLRKRLQQHMDAI